MNNFQELRTSQSHQALPSYAYSISVPQPYPIETTFSFRQNQSTLPLAFNPHSPFKPKLRKAPRPKSRGPQEILRRNEHQDSSVSKQKQEEGFLRVDSNRVQLEDFSKTSSSMWEATKMNGTPQRLQDKKLSSYGCDFRGGPYGMSKQNILRFTETKAYKHAENLSQDSRNLVESATSTWKIVDAHNPPLEPGGPHTSYLLQEIQLQRRTIQSFQQEILRLNQELTDHRQKVAREGNKGEQEENLRLIEGSRFLQAENQKLKRELENRQRYNTYLQTQCKLYVEATDKKILDHSQLEQAYHEAKIKIGVLQEQLNHKGVQLQVQEEDLKKKQTDLERTKKEHLEEIDRLNRLVQAQTSKLNQTERNSQLDRSQISLLMMKLEGLIERNSQLSNSSAEASRWRNFYEEAEREKSKSEDACRHLQQEVTVLSEKLRATVQELRQTKEAFGGRQDFWKCQVNQLIEQNQNLCAEMDSLKQTLVGQNQRLRIAEKTSKTRMDELENQRVSAVDRLERAIADCKSLQALKNVLQEGLRAKDKQIERLNYKEQQTKEKYQLQKVELYSKWNSQKLALTYQRQLTIQDLRESIQHEHQLRLEIGELHVQLQRKNKQHGQALQANRSLNPLPQTQDNETQTQSDEGKICTNPLDICFNIVKQKETQTQSSSGSQEKPPSSDSDLNHREKGGDFIQVDLQGLKYICDLLGSQHTAQGILNSITQSLVDLLADSQERDSCLKQLLDSFEIDYRPGCQQRLLQEIDSLRKSITHLLGWIRQLESWAYSNEQDLQTITQKHTTPSINQQCDERSVSFYQRNLQELNQDLNSEVLFLRAALFNSRLVARDAIGVIQHSGVVKGERVPSTKNERNEKSVQ